jgi:hypothetical protein
MVREEKEVRIPTLKEKIERGISDKDWIMMCYREYKRSKCFRELNGHSLCDLCPKKLEKIIERTEKRSETGRWLTEEQIKAWIKDPSTKII